MARFEVSNVKAGVNAANTIMWQLRTAATSRCRVFEVGLSVATAPTIGPSWRLVRAATLGTTPATQAAEEQDPGGGTPTALLDISWAGAPTLAGLDMRKYATTNTIGSGIVWTWPDHRPLIVPVSSGIIVVNANATSTTPGTFNVYIVFEE